MSGNQDWRTPVDFWTVINKEFNFQFDAACSKQNIKCAAGFTYPDVDSLKIHWQHAYPAHRIWCNPPFKVMQPWVNKCAQFAMYHPDNVAVLLAPLSCAPWMETCFDNAVEIRDVYPRIQFDAPAGVRKSSNAKDNVIVVFKHHELSQQCKRFFWRWK